MAVTLTGYGGISEIGGNAFLLDDGRHRLFLDFGRRFGNDPHVDEVRGLDTRHMRPGIGDYFDEYLQPRGHRMALDLMALGLIPDVPGAYRCDIGGAGGPAGIDGVILSHAHADHCGLIGLLKPEVPVFLSDESRATMASLQETGQSGVESEFITMRAKGYARSGPKGKNPISTNPAKSRPLIPRRLEDATAADVGDWEIRQFTVDHSIHGARGTIVAGKDISVAYTGDFRMHGRLRHETAKFLERAGGVDVLITEGTNVGQAHKRGGGHGHGGLRGGTHGDGDAHATDAGRGPGGHSPREHGGESVDDEASVEAQIEDLAGGEGGLVAIAFPPRDLDRFVSIHHVAKRLGRRLAITTKQAHLLESLRKAGRDDLPDPCTDQSLAIHLRNRGRGTMAQHRGVLTLFDGHCTPERVDVGADEWNRVLATEYAAWEKPYLECPNTTTSAGIGAAPGEWMFSVNYWSITDLLDIFPGTGHDRPGGLYIHSMTQPFNDDMQISDRKLHRWLDAFKLRYTQTHVSGHLSQDDLEHAMDEIGARILVPVHSLYPGLTAERYEARTGQRALLAEHGKRLALG